jgi:hypothetical protein
MKTDVAIANKFFVIDNVLNSEDHKSLYNYLKTLKFTSEWSSTRKRNDQDVSFSWHWNYSFFQVPIGLPAITPEQYTKMIEEHPAVQSLWGTVSREIENRLGKHNILRLYANCNPYGQNAYIHVDDGEYTMVYYPAIEWKSEWEGGTCLYKGNDIEGYDAIRYISYKPNRLIIFPAKIPHRGMPVDKICTAPRYVIAMKLQKDVNNAQYLSEYYSKDENK